MNDFVSRAGEKLAYALKKFEINPSGKVCADFGSSTGGFTDCLLQNNAKKVYAVDTGYGVLEWKLRKDPRVIVLERTNALFVDLPEKVELITIDVGWTPQRLIIPHARTCLRPGGQIISLLKPHYEAEKSWLEKGVVKPEFIEKTLEKVSADLDALNIKIKKIALSPITGKQGKNAEYLILI